MTQLLHVCAEHIFEKVIVYLTIDTEQGCRNAQLGIIFLFSKIEKIKTYPLWNYIVNWHRRLPISNTSTNITILQQDNRISTEGTMTFGSRGDQGRVINHNRRSGQGSGHGNRKKDGNSK